MIEGPVEWRSVEASGTDAVRYCVVGEDVVVHYPGGAAVRVCGCHERWRGELEDGFDSRALVQALMYCDCVERVGDVSGTRFPSYTVSDDVVVQFCRECEAETEQRIRRGMVAYKEADCSSVKTTCKPCGKKYSLSIKECEACGLYAVQEPLAPDGRLVCSRCGELWARVQ